MPDRANPEGMIITEDMVANPDSPQSDDIITDSEIPPTEIIDTDIPLTDSTGMLLDETQFETFLNISDRLDLLTNRFEILLILFIVMLTLFIFNLMRAKT